MRKTLVCDGVQYIEQRPDDPDFDHLIAVATSVLRLTHVGDQNFIACLATGKSERELRLALVALDDVFREGLEDE